MSPVSEDAQPKAAVVPIDSAWFSKVNISGVVTLIASVLTVFHIAFPPEAQNALIDAIFAVAQAVTILGPIAVIVFRTYFTHSVTPQSVQGAPQMANSDAAPQLRRTDCVANLLSTPVS